MYGMLFECGDVCFCWLRFNVDVARSVSGNVGSNRTSTFK